jgi:hypothetical protein
MFNNLRVYIVLGIGSRADSPDEIFVIPMNKLDTGVVDYNSSVKYRYDNSSSFYFDMSEYVLVMKNVSI